MAEKLIRPEDIILLNRYRAIYYSYPMNQRAKHFTKEDERILENAYNHWRGREEKIMGCPSCVEEVFERLMLQMRTQEGKRTELGITEVDKLKENLRPIVQRGLEKQN